MPRADAASRSPAPSPRPRVQASSSRRQRHAARAKSSRASSRVNQLRSPISVRAPATRSVRTNLRFARPMRSRAAQEERASIQPAPPARPVPQDAVRHRARGEPVVSRSILSLAAHKLVTAPGSHRQCLQPRALCHSELAAPPEPTPTEPSSSPRSTVIHAPTGNTPHNPDRTNVFPRQRPSPSNRPRASLSASRNARHQCPVIPRASTCAPACPRATIHRLYSYVNSAVAGSPSPPPNPSRCTSAHQGCCRVRQRGQLPPASPGTLRVPCVMRCVLAYRAIAHRRHRLEPASVCTRRRYPTARRAPCRGPEACQRVEEIGPGNLVQHLLAVSCAHASR